jgi:hypothetical protein
VTILNENFMAKIGVSMETVTKKKETEADTQTHFGMRTTGQVTNLFNKFPRVIRILLNHFNVFIWILINESLG